MYMEHIVDFEEAKIQTFITFLKNYLDVRLG